MSLGGWLGSVKPKRILIQSSALNYEVGIIVAILFIYIIYLPVTYELLKHGYLICISHGSALPLWILFEIALAFFIVMAYYYVILSYAD